MVVDGPSFADLFLFLTALLGCRRAATDRFVEEFVIEMKMPLVRTKEKFERTRVDDVKLFSFTCCAL